MAPVITLIPNYNGGAALLETLASVLGSDYAPHEVLVVDDASPAGTIAQVPAAFPGVTVLRQPDNRGFAHTVNTGMAAARRRGAEYVFLLNNDATVAPDTIRHLAAALDADPRLAAVMPKVYFYDRPGVLQSTGLRVDRNRGVPVQIGWEEADHGQYDEPAPRDSLHGCAMLIRMAAWETIGPFWEPYFAYFEETDWCVRARDHGYQLYYIPAGRVRHHGGLSFEHGSAHYTYLLYRNQLYFVRRNRRDWHWASGLGFLVRWYVTLVARLLKKRRFRHAAAICRAVLDFSRGRTGAGLRRAPARAGLGRA